MKKLDSKKRVWVYRNLKHGRKRPPLYSIMQGGIVVARRHRLLLRDVVFVVRKAGRARVLLTGHKNVHAFAVGYLAGRRGGFGVTGNRAGERLAQTVAYYPHSMERFGTADAYVNGASAVLLNESGMTGTMFT